MVLDGNIHDHIHHNATKANQWTHELWSMLITFPASLASLLQGEDMCGAHGWWTIMSKPHQFPVYLLPNMVRCLPN